MKAGRLEPERFARLDAIEFVWSASLALSAEPAASAVLEVTSSSP
jgi:hypothetical protein